MESVKVTVEMPVEVARGLRVLAASSGRSQKEIVVGLVQAYLVKKEAEHG